MEKTTSSHIRQELKRFDTFFGKKFSKTDQLFDPWFTPMTVHNFIGIVKICNDRIAQEFNVDPGDVPLLWTKVTRDCDKFAGWLVSWAQMLFENRPIFRITADTELGVHAYNIGFTSDDGIWFADLTRGTDIWSIREGKPKMIGFG
jgi:hypothetical protein